MAIRDHRLHYIHFHPQPQIEWEDTPSASLTFSILNWLLICAVIGSLGFIAFQMYSLHPAPIIIHA